MTRSVNDPERLTPFGVWLHKEPALDSKKWHLSIQNADYMVHRFNIIRNKEPAQAVMLLEEKCYMAEVEFAQRDTLSLIDQALKIADGNIVTNLRGMRTPMFYFGYHLIQFEKTDPSNGKVFWNGKEIDIETLNGLIRFQIDPRDIGNVSGSWLAGNSTASNSRLDK